MIPSAFWSALKVQLSVPTQERSPEANNSIKYSLVVGSGRKGGPIT
jgi:hypothetical protein